MFGRKKGGEAGPPKLEGTALPEKYADAEMEGRIRKAMEALGFSERSSQNRGTEATFVGRSNDGGQVEIRITIRGLSDPMEMVNAMER